MENIKIREYKKGDYSKFIDFWVETDLGRPERGDDETVILRTIKLGGRFLVLEDENTGIIIGTSWITSDGRRLYLHHFGIRPQYQNMGFAKQLTIESLRIAKETGLQIKLEVHKENHKAIGLYKKYGFKYLGDYDVYIIRKYN